MEFIAEEGYFNKQYWQVLQNTAGLDVYQLSYPMKVKAMKELEICFDRFDKHFDLSLLKSVHTGLEASMDIQYYNSEAAFTWLSDLDKSIPGQKQAFIDLWPEVYSDMQLTRTWELNSSGKYLADSNNRPTYKPDN
jgi:hypothetical protein